MVEALRSDPAITLNRLRAKGEYQLWESATSATTAVRIMGHSVSTEERHYVEPQHLNAHDDADKIGPIARQAGLEKGRKK